MRRVARDVGFAFLAWLVPFVTSVCLFPLKKSHPPLFDSLMGTALAVSTVVLGCAYLRRAEGSPIARGTKVGLVWVAANWLLDGLMFSGGPMKMSLGQYMGDIGVSYFTIPAITIGLGLAASSRAGPLETPKSESPSP